MIEPFPNWRSICITADSNARFLPFSGGAGTLISAVFAIAIPLHVPKRDGSHFNVGGQKAPLMLRQSNNVEGTFPRKHKTEHSCSILLIHCHLKH
jgi:hypothetical protein